MARLIDVDALSGIAFQIKQCGKGIRCVVDLNDVDRIPTVDAAPVVHGRWVKDGEVVACSECGAEHAWEEYRATYCEDCGAKMDGGNDDDRV